MERPCHRDRQPRAGHARQGHRARRPLGRLRLHGAVHTVDVQAAPRPLEFLLHKSRPVCPLWPHLAVPRLRQRQGAERIFRRRRLREPGLRRGCDHLRRVLLRQELRLPRRQGAQRRGLLHGAHGQLRGSRTAEGNHQHHTRTDLPHPDPGRRVQQRGPPHLPARELLLHDRADRSRWRLHRQEGPDPRYLRQLHALRGAAAGRSPGLLAPADEPRAGRVRPDQASAGRRCQRRRHQQMQQPDIQSR